MTDLELISEVRAGNKVAFEELINRYEPLISSVVSKFLTDELFSQSDLEDLRQEATIALYSAVMSFDYLQDEVSFGLYAKICLGNSLNTALRKRRRQYAADKAQITDEVIYDDYDSDAGLLIEKINSILSEFERSVFKLFIHGYSHKTIAKMLKRSEKSVDNAIYRIRTKLSKKLI